MLRKVLLAAVALAAMAVPANAVLIGGQEWTLAPGALDLTLSPVVPGGNQPRNLPCIICGANQPQQPANFGYNLFGNTGNQTSLPFFSTATVGGSLAPDQIGTGYSIANGSPFLNAVGGRIGFSIGLDVNEANTAQVLESFWFLNLTTHTVLGVLSPDPNTGIPVPAPNNGTGYPDYTINGLTLAGINPGDQIIFFARITGANDGPDSFFLVPGQQAAIPEASTWAMMIAGFGMVGLMATRRRKQKLLRLS